MGMGYENGERRTKGERQMVQASDSPPLPRPPDHIPKHPSGRIAAAMTQATSVHPCPHPSYPPERFTYAEPEPGSDHESEP